MIEENQEHLLQSDVDIFFEDSASREIFGAGQNLWSKGQMKPGMVKRITEAANRVSEKYKLTPEQARKAISGYNKAIRELGSSQPKYGESLNFKAPSFEEFLKDFKS